MDDMKTYYCRRMGKEVVAERVESLVGNVIVQCKYDEDKPGNSCIYLKCLGLVGLVSRRCLVKLAMQREIKKENKLFG